MDNDSKYIISTRLVHWLITTIFTSIIAVGAYMVVWAINDATYKATVLARLTANELITDKIEIVLQSHITEGAHAVSRERIDQLDRRLSRLEKMVDNHK